MQNDFENDCLKWQSFYVIGIFLLTFSEKSFFGGNIFVKKGIDKAAKEYYNERKL